MAHFQDPFLKDLANLSDSEESANNDNQDVQIEEEKREDDEDYLEGEVGGPLTGMIDTSGGTSVKKPVYDQEHQDGALHFSKLKLDEKFIAHIDSIKENLSAPTPLATDQPTTNCDMTQQVFDLIGATNEFLR